MDVLLLLKKIVYAIVELPFFFGKVSRPLVCMTLLVTLQTVLRKSCVSIKRKAG